MHQCREAKAATLNTGKQKTCCDAQNSGKHFSHSWKSRHIRRSHPRHSVRDANKSQISSSDSESNSDEKARSTWSKHRRSPVSSSHASHQHHQLASALQQPLQHPYVDGMSSSERSRPYIRHFESQMPDSEMLTDPTAFFILNGLVNSPFHLCQVLLSLLEKICKFDISISHNPGLTVNVVPKLTEILTDFCDCCGLERGNDQKEVDELAVGWAEESIALAQRMLLRTILHLMSIDMSQSEALPNNLRQSLSDLLVAVLKIHTCLYKQAFKADANPFAPRTKPTLQEVQENFSFSSYRHQALLLPELLEGVLQFLLGCLEASIPNPFFFSQALELIHEFVQHHGLELFEGTCLRLEAFGNSNSEMSGEVMERLRGIISGILKIISVVKRAKSEQIHQSSCARRRHRHCEYSQLLHHHHDVSGLPVTSCEHIFEEKAEDSDWQVRYPESCCILAVCAYKCLRLLPHLSPSGPAVLQVLAGVQAVGICCCMDPRSVVVPLLQIFQAPGLCSHQSYILNVLSRLVLEQLGGEQPSGKSKIASCSICVLDSSQKLYIENTLQDFRFGEEMASSTSPSPVDLPSREGEDMCQKWDALKAYKEIVFGKDWQLSKQIASHVCHLALRGNAVIQWKLYMYIFSPMLQKGVELAHHAHKLGVSKTCSQVCSYHTHCLPVEVLLVYLQALPCLLSTR